MTDQSQQNQPAVAAAAPPVPECGICLDTSQSLIELPEFRTNNGDVLRAKDSCGHRFCGECYRSYLDERVKSQIAALYCPAAGCRTPLFASDVERLAPGVTATRYRELVERDYSQRRGDLLVELSFDELVELAHLPVRTCPHCKVLVQRSEGCNSMWCICGANFSYGNAKGVLDVAPSAIERLRSLAQTANLTVTEALQYCGREGVLRRAIALASKLQVTCAEAAEIVDRAAGGDTAARSTIRAARHAVQAELEETELAVDPEFFDMAPPAPALLQAVSSSA